MQMIDSLFSRQYAVGICKMHKEWVLAVDKFKNNFLLNERAKKDSQTL